MTGEGEVICCRNTADPLLTANGLGGTIAGDDEVEVEEVKERLEVVCRWW